MIVSLSILVGTKGNTDIIDITDRVQGVLKKSGTDDGLVNVFVKGSTASITTIEPDENLFEDLRDMLDKISPMKRDWKHHKTWGDDNGGSHLRSAIFGPCISLPVIGGKLVLGEWQRIVLLDFDTSPRVREIYVTVIN